MENLQKQPLDLYNMIGFCPTKIVKGKTNFAFRNLVDASDAEVIKIQKDLIGFLGEQIFSLPREKTDGLVLHSGTEANETALLIAKRATGKNLVVASNISHSSIERAAEKLGMDFLKLDVDRDTFKVNQKKLEDVLQKEGDKIAVLNITYGTTKLGTGEDFIFDGTLEKIASEKKIWVHTDAAYGGMVMNLAGFEDRKWQKSSLVRSITVDPHKFVGVLGCGVLLLTNPADKKLIGPEVIYFRGNTTAIGTTRSAYPAATALATIEFFGIEKLKKLAKTCVKNAKFVGKNLQKAGLTLIAPIQSGVVPIAMNSESEVEQFKTELLAKGFKVSPINIVNGDYKIFGIRIVVTPKLETRLANLKSFSQALIDVHNQLTKTSA